MTDPETIPLRSFDESLPMALLRARESAMRQFRPLLADHGLTEQQWRVLRALAASSRPIAVSELADRTFLLPPSLSRILSNLESRGLVERRRARHDQRRADISLTRDGTALVTRVAPESERIYERIEAGFGTDRLRELLTELHELAALRLPPAERREAS